jgi:hypothetical protein
MRKYTQIRCSFRNSGYTGYHFFRCKGNNSHEKDIKTYILESYREWAKGLLYHTMYVFGNLHVKDTIQQFIATSI